MLASAVTLPLADATSGPASAGTVAPEILPELRINEENGNDIVHLKRDPDDDASTIVESEKAPGEIDKNGFVVLAEGNFSQKNDDHLTDMVARRNSSVKVDDTPRTELNIEDDSSAWRTARLVGDDDPLAHPAKRNDGETQHPEWRVVRDSTPDDPGDEEEDDEWNRYADNDVEEADDDEVDDEEADDEDVDNEEIDFENLEEDRLEDQVSMVRRKRDAMQYKESEEEEMDDSDEVGVDDDYEVKMRNRREIDEIDEDYFDEDDEEEDDDAADRYERGDDDDEEIDVEKRDPDYYRIRRDDDDDDELDNEYRQYHHRSSDNENDDYRSNQDEDDLSDRGEADDEEDEIFVSKRDDSTGARDATKGSDENRVERARTEAIAAAAASNIRKGKADEEATVLDRFMGADRRERGLESGKGFDIELSDKDTLDKNKEMLDDNKAKKDVSDEGRQLEEMKADEQKVEFADKRDLNAIEHAKENKQKDGSMQEKLDNELKEQKDMNEEELRRADEKRELAKMKELEQRDTDEKSAESRLSKRSDDGSKDLHRQSTDESDNSRRSVVVKNDRTRFSRSVDHGSDLSGWLDAKKTNSEQELASAVKKLDVTPRQNLSLKEQLDRLEDLSIVISKVRETRHLIFCLISFE